MRVQLVSKRHLTRVWIYIDGILRNGSFHLRDYEVSSIKKSLCGDVNCDCSGPLGYDELISLGDHYDAKFYRHYDGGGELRLREKQ